MFRIEMLPAYHGDSIWIEWGDRLNPNRLLVDAGLVGTYTTIVDRAGAQCHLELFCVTHVDQDHVEGAVKLLANLPKGVDIRQVWFNGWDQVSGASRLGAVQGEKLGAAILNHAGSKWNTSFDGKAVVVPEGGPLPERVIEGLTLTVLSPRKEELAILRPVWEKECAKAGLIPGSVEGAEEALVHDRRLHPRLGASVDVEALASEAYEPDSSPANGSSIALLAEYDGKSVLLCADAHSEVLEAGIQRLLAARGERKIELDAIKVSHHGSKRNSSPRLIDLLDCPRWLVSTNGDKFQHPDRETIARILLSRKRDQTELYFNYRSEYNEIWDADRLRRDWHYRAAYPKSPKGGIVAEL
jgi:beta-lactamase superfamily II metal-dependent hydrolase